MKIDIIELGGYTQDNYTLDGEEIKLEIPEEFWVIDRSSLPIFKFAGPFSLEEAKRFKAKLEILYQKLVRSEIDFSAFKNFIEQENIKIESNIREDRQAKLAAYERIMKTPAVDNELDI
ncbi:hypothetical protein HKD28_15110 [Gluconobacter sp. LMG 1744]|uniref:hypothetical protein n=1 Tax=Gluconobacter cadivus TaxID=2728101 RepID=UPI001885299F|nr:hypothetical protein [Gluconobacter cadivus]MBF0892720.1 hypothetical protein [Gluconobacter cadivus]